MNQVLLVCAPGRDPERYPDVKPGIVYCPPLHLGYLAALLLPQGFEVRIVDMRIEGVGLQGIGRIVQNDRPDIVGISCTTTSYPQGLAIARRVKEVRPPTLVVMGGCHVTFMAQECLAENPQLDAVVRGEGEFTLLELALAWKQRGALRDIAGLSYRDGDEDAIIHNPARPFITDLDSLPWPARHLMTSLHTYDADGSLFTSRGCPHACIFCAASAMSGRRYRTRSAAQVVDEMEHLIRDYGFSHLTILDDTFTALPKRLTLPVCQEIERRGLQMTFDCESRADVVTPELCDALVRAGCIGIQFGVESGSQAVLDASHKGITLEQVRNAIRWARAAGIHSIVCSFILGHVHDTEETIRETILFWQELQAMGVAKIPFAPLTPFPGTDVYEKRQEYGVVIHETDWSKFNTYTPVMSTRYLSRDRLRELYLDAAFKLTGSLP
jgi:anaerobic magnesium-protoporphyrin IX monomethyl ester cyclase